MRKFSSAMILILFMSLTVAHLQAKRGAPKDVPPVTRNGITYTAPHEHMGCVIAKDGKDNLIFNKQIYVVKYDPDLEKDIQDTFITELRFDGDKLIVMNERGSQFELNVSTLACKVLKGTDMEVARK